jgi:ferredoxin
MAANPKPTRERVRCVVNGKAIDVWQGYRLWDAAYEADAGLWRWCGGDGLCGTCAVIPVSGAENLTAPTKLERFSLAMWFLKPLALVRKRWKGRGARLACQAYVNGPVEVVGVLGKTAKPMREAAGIES